jgi:hypothetical protein
MLWMLGVLSVVLAVVGYRAGRVANVQRQVDRRLARELLRGGSL